MEVNIETNILKAKIELMTKSVFISTICLSVRHVITDSVPTAATNNKTIFYNPDFIGKLSVGQLAGLIAHECWHIAFQHLNRRGEREPVLWNVAGDYKINFMLQHNGFELPVGGLYNPKYDDEWTTDGVYSELEEEGFQPDLEDMMLDITGDTPDSDDDSAASKAEVADILVRAHTQSKIAGKDAGEIPGEILRVLDELLNPQIPWPIVLNKFIDQKVREKYTWARRNRRFPDVFLPSLHNYGLSHLTWAIDTSGSRNNEELKATLTEIRSVQRTMSPERMTIIDCDSRIQSIHEITAQTDILSLKFSGGGGTRFQPVLDYIEDHPTQALIYFTDLYGETDLERVNYPILWICNSDHAPANIGETVYIK